MHLRNGAGYDAGLQRGPSCGVEHVSMLSQDGAPG